MTSPGTEGDIVNCESDPGNLGSLSVFSYSPHSMRAIHYVPFGPVNHRSGDFAAKSRGSPLSSIKLAVPEGIGSAVWWSTCLPGFRQRALEQFAHLTAHPAGFPLRQGVDDEQVLALPADQAERVRGVSL